MWNTLSKFLCAGGTGLWKAICRGSQNLSLGAVTTAKELCDLLSPASFWTFWAYVLI